MPCSFVIKGLASHSMANIAASFETMSRAEIEAMFVSFLDVIGMIFRDLAESVATGLSRRATVKWRWRLMTMGQKETAAKKKGMKLGWYKGRWK